MSFRRIAGLAGLIFVVLLIVNAALLGDQPLPDDSVQEVRDYLSDDRGIHQVGMFIGVLVLPFAVAFFAGVFTKLRENDRRVGAGWGVAAIASAVLLGAAAGVGDVLAATAMFRGGEGLDDATLRALWDGQVVAYSSTGIALAALTLSAAVPTLRDKVWPSWHGVLGIVVAVLGVLSILSVVDDDATAFGFIGFVGFMVWTVATSVLMLREPAAAEPPV